MEDFHKSFNRYVNEYGHPPDEPIRIAILDTGIDKQHVGVDFDGVHMKDEWCCSFVDGAQNFHDEDGHGTHCASLLRKIAPDAEIYILKVFSRNEFDLKQARNISKVRRSVGCLPLSKTGFSHRTGLSAHITPILEKRRQLTRTRQSIMQ